MKKTRLRIIGDCHGKIDEYLKLTKNAQASIQVGDMGFAAEYKKLDESGLSLSHRFVPGNHDDLDAKSKYSLGDFGIVEIPNFSKVFFIRGAWSIDHWQRKTYDAATGGKSWWPQEELSFAELNAALKLYQQCKPDFVVSHDCPQCIKMEVADPSMLKRFGYDRNPVVRTSLCLQAMFESHQPHYWIFGHYHKSFREHRNGTIFQCLNELEYADFDRKPIPLTNRRVVV